MATLSGVNRKLTNVDVPAGKAGIGEQDGKVRVAYDEYQMGAVLAAADTIEFMTLPKGARILDAQLSFASLGATGIIDLGISGDQNYLINQADGGGQAVADKMGAGAAGAFAKLVVDTLIIAECTELSVNTNVLIKCAVTYILD